VLNVATRYTWTFHDGTTAVGETAQKTYTMAGEYAWSLLIDDDVCGQATRTGTIYVYDWTMVPFGSFSAMFDFNLSVQFSFFGSQFNSYLLARSRGYNWYTVGSRLNVSFTNRCLRYSLKPSQGMGWSQFGGEGWPFPEARVGTLRILDDNDRERLLVLDATSCDIYEIGVRDLFRDAETSYGGLEIPTSVQFKEERGSAEHYFLRSMEHHAEFRPYYEGNKRVDGYTAQGYRDAFEVDYVLRKDGEHEIDTLITKDIPITGDITFKYDEEGHRWQPIIRTSASEYKLVRMRNYYERLDKPASPDNRIMSEHDYCLELMDSCVYLGRQSSQVSAWINNGSLEAPTNYATGNPFGGSSYAGFAEGPDGRANSAISFVDTNVGVASLETVSLPGDFTAMVWSRGANNADILAIFSGFVLDLTGATLDCIDSGGTTLSVSVDWDLSAWNLYTVVRSGSVLRLYVNKTLKGTIDWPVVEYTGPVAFMNLAHGEIFEGRILNSALSAGAIGFHYDDVTIKTGKATCKLF